MTTPDPAPGSGPHPGRGRAHRRPQPGVSEKAAELAEKISKYARVKLDDSDNAPGWKFSQWEMKGVPLRLEIGPKDLEKNQCVLVRRDTREKIFVSLDELETAIPAQLEALRKDLYQRALANREKRTWAATTWRKSRSWPRPTPATSKPCGAATWPAR